MTDPYDRLDRALTDVQMTMVWDQANRRGLLWAHATVGVWAGVLVWIWGTAALIEKHFGLLARPALGTMALVGGLLLIAGLTRRPRGIRFEATGLVLLWIWDFAMCAAFVYARLLQDDFGLRPLFEPLPVGYLVAYPVPVYAGYCVLISVHLWTLRQIWRFR